jgi:hypothetical protein
VKGKYYFSMLIFVFKPVFAWASVCEVPRFEKFSPASFRDANSEMKTLELGMQPLANLRIPSGFLKWGASPHGSVVFGKHAKGIKGGVAFETRESISVHQKNVSPADFFLSVFTGGNDVGCKYLLGQNLESQEYRLHAIYPNGAELFAFGRSDEHHFYLIRGDKPEYVLNGLVRGISRSEFESILSTINF